MGCSLLITFGLVILIPMLSGNLNSDLPPAYTSPVRISKIVEPEEPQKRESERQEEKEPPRPEKLKTVTMQPVRPTPPRPEIMLPRLDFLPVPDKAATVALPVPTVAESSPPSSNFKGAEFSLGDVDTAPRLIRHFPPPYPMRAKRSNIEGKVVVRALITPDGRATRISVVSAQPSNIFETSVIKAVSRWRFQPGTLHGEKVSTWIEIPVVFKLN